MLALVDQEIAHISRAMKLSLVSDLGGPILPADYWRKRLHALLDSYHLTKGQLCMVDSLLLQLDVQSGTHVARRAAAVALAGADHEQPLAESELDALSAAIAAASHGTEPAVGDATAATAAL
jgi:hypothetical protein